MPPTALPPRLLLLLQVIRYLPRLRLSVRYRWVRIIPRVIPTADTPTHREFKSPDHRQNSRVPQPLLYQAARRLTDMPMLQALRVEHMPL